MIILRDEEKRNAYLTALQSKIVFAVEQGATQFISGMSLGVDLDFAEIILKLNREQGITVLISSHILDELSRLATYFGFIENGQMVKEISASELEAACRKCIHLVVSDVKALSKVLDEIGLEYTIFLIKKQIFLER